MTMREMKQFDSTPLGIPGGLALMFLSVSAFGQQTFQPSQLADDTEIEEIRRYSVELIVFEYNGGDSGGSEVFLADELPVLEPTLSDTELMEFGEASPEPINGAGEPLPMEEPEVANADEIENLPFTGEELVLNEIPGLHSIGFEILQPSDYSLDDIYERLENLDAYEPLMRTAWIQQTVEEDKTRELKLRRLGNPPLKLDGTVSLYLSRYLHLVIDLALQEKDTPEQESMAQTDGAVSESADNPQYYGDRPMESGYEYDPYAVTRTGPLYYRIQEDRIVRNGELRYYDHPKFGVIAKITRVEEAISQPGSLEPAVDD